MQRGDGRENHDGRPNIHLRNTGVQPRHIGAQFPYERGYISLGGARSQRLGKRLGHFARLPALPAGAFVDQIEPLRDARDAPIEIVEPTSRG